MSQRTTGVLLILVILAAVGGLELALKLLVNAGAGLLALMVGA
jgi:hypothetical protein